MSEAEAECCVISLLGDVVVRDFLSLALTLSPVVAGVWGRRALGGFNASIRF